MRIATILLAGVSASLLLTVHAFANPIEVTKAYRDYPGYINPTVCDNQTWAKPPRRKMWPRPQRINPANLSLTRTAMTIRLMSLMRLFGGGSRKPTTSGIDAFDSHEEVTVSNGFGGGLAVGYDFGPARLEVEGSYRKSNTDESDATLRVKAHNGQRLCRLHNRRPVTPYLGVGVGAAESLVRKTTTKCLPDRQPPVFCLPFRQKSQLILATAL